jgi:hypothetical protein
MVRAGAHEDTNKSPLIGSHATPTGPCTRPLPYMYTKAPELLNLYTARAHAAGERAGELSC